MSDMKDSKITLSMHIGRTPSEIFPWIADPDKAMHWQKGVQGGEILHETPEKIGTRFKEILAENGKTLEMFGEITDYVENRSISFHLESKIHIVDTTFSIQSGEDGSEFSAEWTIRWKFPVNLIHFFAGNKIKRKIIKQSEAEFVELKRLCETS